MNANKAIQRIIRKKYSSQFKDQALERAAKDGIPLVEKDRGLSESILYSWRRGMRRGVIVLSDRGSQYCSHDYQKLLTENPTFRSKFSITHN